MSSVTVDGVVWTGQYALVVQPREVEWSRGGGFRVIDRWRGPRSLMDAHAAQLRNTYGADGYRLRPLRGNAYECTAEWESQTGGGSSSYEETWEMTPLMLEKDLRMHPDFSGITDEMETIDLAIARGEAADMTGLSSDGEDYRDLRLRGTDKYMDYGWVIRRVRVTGLASAVEESVTYCMRVGSAPSVPASAHFDLPSGFEWLKMPPDVRTVGGRKVEVSQEWWGAEEWSHMLYNGGGSP